MFAKTIIDSDAFLDMPVTAQLLYFHLAMRADDDGFINKPKSIMRMTGATQGDAEILINKKFIIPFESGIVVIKHWKIHNYIRKDMYHETKYKEEKMFLDSDDNGAYRVCNELVTNPLQTCNELVTNPSTQDRIGKDRIGKDNNKNKKSTKPNYESVLSDIDDEELKGLYHDYIEMRKLIKEPMTQKALQMLISKVESLEPNDIDRQKLMLKKSIMNNWKSVYPLKKDDVVKQESEKSFIELLEEGDNNGF